MAHDEDLTKSEQGQYFCRSRRCLLKGCEHKFQPKVPSSRYCSEECREKARLWRIRRASEQYRRTAKGKIKRCKQARDRRQRAKIQKCDETGATGASVGDHHESHQGVMCARVGCYERVLLTRRSPCQKYCSCGCCLAMHRVIERERRWHKYLREHER